MNCFSCERNLSAYIDDELGTEIRRQMEDHFDQCDSCRSEYNTHLAAWETTTALSASDASTSLWQAIENDLGTNSNATTTEDLGLMLRGLASQVQELQKGLDDMRRQMEESGWNATPEERDTIQIPSSPYRAVRPRASSVAQLRDNPLTQLRRT
jgi:hypothetical protein